MACSCSTNKQTQVKRVTQSPQHYIKTSNTNGRTGVRRVIRRVK